MTDPCRARRWAGGERRVALVAAAALVVAGVALRMRPPHRLLPSRSRAAGPGAVDAARALAIVHGVARRLPWSCPCLVRAVAAAWTLAWLGETAVVHLAVRSVPGGIEAHAWTTTGDWATDAPASAGWQTVTRWPVPTAPAT